VLIYWPINAWRNDCLRKISVMIFKTKIDSLKDKKIGLNFCIDKNVPLVMFSVIYLYYLNIVIV
ncbi:hypothetical protein, partial [Bacteroides caccae]|uniref:hypothetical protein n=1 Tax=Bacteroides caccae TaxID=47678 RepID=UPI00195F9B62